MWALSSKCKIAQTVFTYWMYFLSSTHIAGLIWKPSVQIHKAFHLHGIAEKQ